MLVLIIALIAFGSCAVGFIGGYAAGHYEGYGDGYYARANNERV